MLAGMTETFSRPAGGIALGLAAAMAIGMSAVGMAGQSANGAAPAGPPALFTDAQAASGEAQYRQSCAGCHGSALTGGTAPALTGPAFEASWSDPRVTLADIFFLARTSMPPRASSSLSAQEHAAVFAYILKMNGFPSGPNPLAAASQELEAAHLRPDAARAPARPAPPAFIPGAPGAVPATTGPDQATLTASARSTTGCSTRTITAAPASRRSRRSTRRRRAASRRRVCSRWASATTFRPARLSTTARCT